MAGIGRRGSFSLGLLLGSLIGTGLALLLAPERGDETRRRVRSRAEPLAERAKDTVTRLARRGERPVEEGEEAAGPDAEVKRGNKPPSGPTGETAKGKSSSEETGDGG